MDGIFGMAGQIAAGAMAADAAKYAADKQTEALENQRKFVFENLDPNKIAPMAEAADIDRAKSRLALQGITDPALLATRYAAQDKMLGQLEQVGQGPGQAVADQAAFEALQGGDVASQMKQRLIDSALSELEQGATLPPDVQAEIVRAGLERSGSVSGAATSKGLGGNITREMVGERALALKSERQGKALAMTQAADALEQNRANILGSLFPALKQTQLAELGASQGALASSSAEMPQAGLSGESIANIWMARVGATNQLAQSAADAQAKGALGQAQAWSGAIGGATRAASNSGTFSDIASFFKSKTPTSAAGSMVSPGPSGFENVGSALALFGG